MNDENERKCALCGSPDFILASIWRGSEASNPCEHLKSLATVRAQFQKIREVAIAVKILEMSRNGSPVPDVVFFEGRRIF
jgi:CRISPR/Cas system-associated protein Cas10 (large subunit of type III CRISPR-Cas system)